MRPDRVTKRPISRAEYMRRRSSQSWDDALRRPPIFTETNHPVALFPPREDPMTEYPEYILRQAKKAQERASGDVIETGGRARDVSPPTPQPFPPSPPMKDPYGPGGIISPPGLWPGPWVDDKPTWYGWGRDVPDGWPWRSESEDWLTSPGLDWPNQVVQCRRPEPMVTITLNRSVAYAVKKKLTTMTEAERIAILAIDKALKEERD